MSSFHGLEMAKRALFAQQSALYTTGHNISNANTKGYTRQRVNFETTTAYPAASRNRPEIPGQIGTGVEAGSVQRVRDKFLDYQFRSENSRSGFWTSKSEALSRMETVLNEPSDNGLASTMEKFWNSLQELAVNPDNSGARSVVANRGMAVAETFQHLSKSLSSHRSDLKNQIDTTVKETNSLLRQIGSLNEQISELEPHGYLPNDLYDRRDNLIDKLSSKMNIKVTYSKSSESSPKIADGIASIEVVDNTGNSFQPNVVLINGTSEQQQINEFTVEYGSDPYASVTGISVNGETVNILESNGTLGGLIDSYGHDLDGDGAIQGTYTDMLTNLDKMATEMAKEFNRVHRSGKALDGTDGIDFFVFKNGKSGAAGITVNQLIMDEPDNIAASTNETDGEGANALALSEVFTDKSLAGNPLGENTSINSFYDSLIGEMGVEAEEAKRMTENTGILKSQVEEQRMSVSSVSLDEEMSNMIKFQHAYNAAARSMTTIDEMLDRVINNMGLVGR
ncbi:MULTISPECIES: flagellar hook-associated protein FlgK [Virgibacillus]|uniref:Flagellar hook-associated protein 1 n=1 Tax=Virgibacillus dokdonensis TaxID=302167 RepID=A0A2K9IU47_9BACI|nr:MULTISPECIES: flagellar hook-associated protein FlgK [Virgibacillus]AUJ23287.1 Flagellar hook-associated protein 1 [Virgibacillus dokdonensis]NWO14024.1 flagellar hook-associated protein FlgK [Virgibacillus sp.]